MKPTQPTLVVTPGMGIGPEVTLRAIEQRQSEGQARLPLRLIGRRDALERANHAVRIPLDGSTGVWFEEPPDEGLPTEAAAIQMGVTECLEGRAGALVTGPIHKKRLRERGFSYNGHTDFLASLCDAESVMAFHGPRFSVGLVTTHLPLADVPAAIQTDRVRYTIQTFALALRDVLGIAHPRIGVCGLNPHAGEQGVLGMEEISVIEPVVDSLRQQGWQLLGPASAETCFLMARNGELDGVVAMFHDQALVPLKVLDFGQTVNWTLGLPIVRTSVDHGTADALVGTGTANPSSMVSALALAEKIVLRRAETKPRS